MNDFCFVLLEDNDLSFLDGLVFVALVDDHIALVDLAGHTLGRDDQSAESELTGYEHGKRDGAGDGQHGGGQAELVALLTGVFLLLFVKGRNEGQQKDGKDDLDTRGQRVGHGRCGRKDVQVELRNDAERDIGRHSEIFGNIVVEDVGGERGEQRQTHEVHEFVEGCDTGDVGEHEQFSHEADAESQDADGLIFLCQEDGADDLGGHDDDREGDHRRKNSVGPLKAYNIGIFVKPEVEPRRLEENHVDDGYHRQEEQNLSLVDGEGAPLADEHTDGEGEGKQQDGSNHLTASEIHEKAEEEHRKQQDGQYVQDFLILVHLRAPFL